ncbi:MAG: sensor histidine kinase [Clostridium sp.]
MRKKLMLHYFLSFIFACLIIVIINIWFMRSNVYKEGALYNYHPEKYLEPYKEQIYLDDGKVKLSEEGINELNKNNSGIQILDSENREVYEYNKPKDLPSYYSNVGLFKLFGNEDGTPFLDEIKLGETTYTYILFLDSNIIKRTTFVYDAPLIEQSHKFPILITLNILVLIIMSFLFTLRIVKPINRIIDRIIHLSEGDYSNYKVKKSIYYNVESNLNQLGEKLLRNEEERKELEIMREEWISNISHDIKTPLTSIIGNAEIMGDTDYPLDDSSRAKYCTTIIKKGEYIKNLVEDLNLSARLKNGSLELKKKRVNIVSLIRHVLIDIINDEKYPHDNITFNYKEEDLFVELDEGLIKRVFVNLIINSFIHNNSDVQVNIMIQKNTNNVEIVVEDNGKGVNEKELLSIFKRYYRGTNTRKKTEGSGLGMAIAHDIIVAHNGKIQAFSEEGKGLRTKILLGPINNS